MANAATQLPQAVSVKSIRIDGGTQPRTFINEDLVEEYADAMRSGAVFPEVTTFFDGVDYWLADGFHRTHAAVKAGIEYISAEVINGTKRDAILYSVGANASHGQRRTNSDKRKAVMTLLQDKEWGQWSNAEIARRCAVHHQMVGKLRDQLSLDDSSSEQPARRTYTTKHGTQATMRTENIGRSRPEVERIKAPPAEESKQQISRDDAVGLRRAHEAIQILHSIPYGDRLRNEAFQTVADWISANR